MKWIHDYQLFLFDFDGLLVNTELLHFKAYKQMLRNRNFDLDWDFDRYIQIAHYRAEGLEEQMYKKFPKLQEMEPNWSTLYAEKKQALIDLFHSGEIELMPGVVPLLKELEKAQIKRCVVTHSDFDLVSILKAQNPALQSIPEWITRRDYEHPKPNSECYVKAIEKFAEPTDNIIGFEDTPRGMRALLGTRAKPVLVSRIDYPEIDELKTKGVVHYKSFEDFPEDQLP